MPVDVSERVVREAAERARRELPRASEVHGVVGDFERHLERVPAAGGDAARSSRCSAARSATSRRARAAAAARRRARCSAPTTGCLLGTDLVKDPAVIEAAYDDAAGRHRRVQPQRAARDQPRARRRLRPRRVRARRVLRPPPRVDRDAPARAARLHACSSPTLGLQRRVRRRRGAAHRDQREVHARAPRGATSRPPGLQLRRLVHRPRRAVRALAGPAR